MKVQAAFSAPVRGQAGELVGTKEKQENVDFGLGLGITLQLAFPESLDLYIPHEHEEIIDELWRNGVPGDAIVAACCQIIKTKQLLIVFTGHGISSGMQEEIRAAEELGLVIFRFAEWGEQAKECLARIIAKIREDTNGI